MSTQELVIFAVCFLGGSIIGNIFTQWLADKAYDRRVRELKQRLTRLRL